MIRKYIYITGWVFLIISFVILVSTIQPDNNPATRLKAEAMGGHLIPEATKQYKHILMPTAGLSFLSGMVCFQISSSVNKRKKKK